MLDLNQDDIDDVAKVLAGETENFSRLVERHGDAILRQMRNFSPTPAISEELTHDVFVEAYLNLANFRREAPFRHWLARIATITGYRYWKTRDKLAKTVEIPEDLETPAVSGGRDDPEAAFNLLHSLLAELPVDDRVVLTLMYLEKCEQKEIAVRLGCSQTAVAVRIFRAKRKLKKLGKDEKWRKKLEWMTS